MRAKSVKGGNGMSGSGLGHPLVMGVTGPGGKFSGTMNPQDIERKVSGYSGEESGPSVPKNVGISQRRTGGMNRKFAGVVGATQAKGTK